MCYFRLSIIEKQKANKVKLFAVLSMFFGILTDAQIYDKGYPMEQYQMLLLSVFLLLLSGCSVLNEYYINNHTESDILITLTYSDDAMLSNDTPQISYAPLHDSIVGGSHQSFTEQVLYQNTGSGAIQFSLPSKSTAFLGMSGGGDKLYTRLQVDTETDQLIISGEEHRQYFDIRDNLVGAIVNVLNVE